MPAKHLLIAALATVLAPLSIAAQEDPETFTPNGPILELRQSVLTQALAANAGAVRNTGALQWSQGDALISALCSAANATINKANTDNASTAGYKPATTLGTQECQRTAFIHLLRFKDEDHEKTQYQKWFVRESVGAPFGEWLTKTRQGLFEASFVRGEQDFLFIYVHFLSKDNEDYKDANGELKHKVGYEITVAKRRPQIISDAILLAQVLGVAGTGVTAASREPEDPIVAYFSIFPFHSSYSRSDLTIAATLQPKSAQPKGKADDTAANATVKKSYVNEKPQWVGLSIAVPLNSYRDVDYNQTNNSLEAKTVKRENVYAVGNLYLPPVDIGQTQFRWLPHLLFGVPIKGQPLRHLMAGAGIGLNWVEPFAGVVFNRQQIPVSAGSTQLQDHLVRKLVVGINIPIATAKAALTKK